MLHNVNCHQPFSICNKWFTLVGLIVGGSHAKVGGTRNQIASITVLHPCPLAQLTGKILNNRHQSRNTKKAMVAVTNKRWNSNTIFNVSCVGGSRPKRLIWPWTLESRTMRRKREGGSKTERGQFCRRKNWSKGQDGEGRKYFQKGNISSERENGKEKADKRVDWKYAMQCLGPLCLWQCLLFLFCFAVTSSLFSTSDNWEEVSHTF